MEINSYIIIYILSLLVLGGTANYVYQRRKNIDEMHGMMIGMTFGTMAGLITGTFFVIPTGNFLLGVIIATFAGLIFGIPFGKLGGHLGIMEGIIAGPMGGIMGSMLGQMIRPFNLSLFMPFFTFILLITLAGISYAVNCKANCCNQKSTSQTTKSNRQSTGFFLVWGVIAIILIMASVILKFSLETKIDTTAADNKKENSNTLQLPPGLKQFAKEERKETVLKEGYQEIDLQITGLKYSPNLIIAKKGILLKINARAEKNAGCAREIAFPDFNVNEIIPAGGTKTIEIMPANEGTF